MYHPRLRGGFFKKLSLLYSLYIHLLSKIPTHCMDNTRILDYRLFVGGLPDNIDESELSARFSSYGDIKDTYIARKTIIDEDTNERMFYYPYTLILDCICLFHINSSITLILSFL